MANPPDYHFYEVLNISKDSSPQDIRNAYKALVKKWHPDKHPASSKPEAEARFKAITLAYEALTKYRNMLGVNKQEARSEEFKNDASCSMPNLTDMATSARRKSPAVERKLECTLEELYRGCEKEVRFTRHVITKSGLVVQREESCSITVKPGWKKGTRIVFEGKGGDRPGFLPADLVFVVSEKEHPLFKRVGNDLELRVDVPLVNALTGWTFSFTLLNREKMKCSFRDEIIFPGFKKVIRGQGMPLANEMGMRGDLRIKFRVVFPTRLSKEQRLGIAKLLRDSD